MGVNLACSPVGTGPHILVHWNHMLHGDLASLSILLFGPFSMIICVGPLGLLYPHCGRDIEHLATFIAHLSL